MQNRLILTIAIKNCVWALIKNDFAKLGKVRTEKMLQKGPTGIHDFAKWTGSSVGVLRKFSFGTFLSGLVQLILERPSLFICLVWFIVAQRKEPTIFFFDD
jgi:hypothetical protein